MASVWCAHDRTLDRNVAIKLLAAPYANDELAGRRFTREARAAARLSGHTNVVTIYDVGRAMPSDEVPTGRPFIVMEYLAGGTVADARRVGAVDLETSLTWLREAAAALDYAHRRGVIHRDVKLSNFLLDRSRVLHVADFGIAQLGTEDTLSATGHVVGTAAYLAPERALGLPATESSDRYALAVAAFELLVGQRPFTATHFAAQVRQHIEQPPPNASERNAALPAAVDAVLARGMAKHPEERYASAGELVDAIEQSLTPPPARRTSPPVRVAPAPAISVYGTRGRTRVAALAALGAALVAVALAAGAAIVPRTQRAAAITAHGLHAQHGARSHATRPGVASDRPISRGKATATKAAKTKPATTKPAATKPAVTTSSPVQPATGAAALAAQGHELMAGGNYHGAVQLLRQAVSAAPRSSLTYAYALFDLGRSLRLAGDPRAAVSILWQRLQIPNQTDTVRAELTLALEALGQSAGSSGGASAGGDGGPIAAKPPGHHDGQPRGPGNSQGD
jgi:serine/threonine-protein kinase